MNKTLTSISSGLYSIAESMDLNHASPIFWLVMIELRIESRTMTSMSLRSAWDGLRIRLCVLLCDIIAAVATACVRSSVVLSEVITSSSSPGLMLKIRYNY